MRTSVLRAGWALVSIACAAPVATAPTPAAHGVGTHASEQELSQPSSPPPRPTPAPPRTGPACSDDASGELARLSCDGRRILLAGPLVVHPEREVPEAATRALLDAVAALLERRPDVLLVRIEARTSTDPGSDPRRRKLAVEQTQERADAVLRYLTRSRPAWAERLEPIGYGFDASRPAPGGEQRFSIELSVAQSARAPADP